MRYVVTFAPLSLRIRAVEWANEPTPKTTTLIPEAFPRRPVFTFARPIISKLRPDNNELDFGRKVVGEMGTGLAFAKCRQAKYGEICEMAGSFEV